MRCGMTKHRIIAHAVSHFDASFVEELSSFFVLVHPFYVLAAFFAYRRHRPLSKVPLWRVKRDHGRPNVILTAVKQLSGSTRGSH